MALDPVLRRTNGADERVLSLLLAGDVMTGRGVDQVLVHPGSPTLHEQFVLSALDYVALAETRNGPIPRRAAPPYIWGDALGEPSWHRADVRLINLETAVTARGSPEPKGINYRMHPDNVGVLSAAGIHACSLANNHVLDWGPSGLADTLDTLARAGIGASGAGHNDTEAFTPLAIPVPGKGRLLILALGCESSGIPRRWLAGPGKPGVALLPDLSGESVSRIAGILERHRQPGDTTVVSIHWGGNWGYDIPEAHRKFAHKLVGEAHVDVVHGHSSHHPRAIEVYRQKLILYGCGDLLNDYEGIEGHEAYHGNLVLLYSAVVGAGDGALRRLDLLPFRIERFSLRRARREEAEWLAATLSREGRTFGTRLELTPEATLRLRWAD
jgi:poly-gamma-glutamate synthesis protein (capsule biosynthesis protein)